MLTQQFDLSKDYFAVLGVPLEACDKTIKAAYRKMARRFHPDVCVQHDAKSRFQEVAEAYEVLSRHKQAYTRARFQQQARNAQNQHDTFYRARSWQAGRTPVKGRDRVMTYPLTLRYAIRLLHQGHFYLPGIKIKMKFNRDAFEGKTFRIPGKGYPGLYGGAPGDYLVKFKISQESLSWRLEGADLYGEVKVPACLLVPGKKIQFESPVGRLSLVVPQNYQQGKLIRLQNKGLPCDERGLSGHLYAKLIAA